MGGRRIFHFSVGRRILQLPAYWLSEDNYYLEREEDFNRYWQLSKQIAIDTGREPEDYQSWRAKRLSDPTWEPTPWRFNHIGGFFEVFIHGQTVKVDAWVRRGRSGRVARTMGFTPVGRVAEADFGAVENGPIRDALRRAIGYADEWVKRRHPTMNWWIDCDESLIDSLDFEKLLMTRAP